MSNLGTALAKKIFRTSAMSSFLSKIMSFSMNVTLLDVELLSENISFMYSEAATRGVLQKRCS